MRMRAKRKEGRKGGGGNGKEEKREGGRAYLGGGDRCDELSPVFGDTLILVLPTHHEARDVLRRGRKERAKKGEGGRMSLIGLGTTIKAREG